MKTYQRGDALRKMVQKEAHQLWKKVEHKPAGTRMEGPHVWVEKYSDDAYNWGCL